MEKVKKVLEHNKDRLMSNKKVTQISSKKTKMNLELNKKVNNFLIKQKTILTSKFFLKYKSKHKYPELC